MSLHRFVLLALLAAFVARIALTYRVFNDTIDENAHIIAGLEYLQRGTYTFEAQHPPLARVAVAVLPFYLADLRLGDSSALWREGPWGQRDLAYYWRTLSLARAGNLVFAILTFFLVYRWSSLLFGKRAGVAACLILACCPTLIGHSSLATLDIAAAATTVLAAFFFWRWCERPGWMYCLASGAAFGIATLSKFSAAFFLAPLAAVFFVTSRWKSWRRVRLAGGAGRALPRAAAFLVVAAAIVWAGYRFDVGALAPAGHRYLSPFQLGHEMQGVPRLLTRSIETRTLPAPRFWQGLIDVLVHDQHGHMAYMLGELSQKGWWYYFPLAVGLKTTLPMLLLFLMGVGIYAVRRRAEAPRGLIYPLEAVLMILAVSMASNLNIGVRHVLAIYPFFAIVAASLWSDVYRVRLRAGVRIAALALLGWHAAESVAAHPDYLAYFNQVARGKEERFLADSNLDWGQDLARLSQYARQHGIENFQMSYFGVTSPAKMEVPHTALSWTKPEPGWAAVSVNHLVGIGLDPKYSRWLRERRPDAVVGKSIWLYHLSAAEKVPAVDDAHPHSHDHHGTEGTR